MDQMDLDSETPDLNGGMAVANGAEPVDADENTEPLTLAQKIIAIRRECAGIGKEDISMNVKKKDGSGYREVTYKAHTIEGVLVAVRHLLNEYNVIVTPSLVERTYNGNRCDVIFDFTWECADSGDTRVVRYAGADTDYGGKGFAKAGTNALKEHLKKFLLITDRDDAKEETENLEHVTEEGMAREAVQKAEDDAKAMFEAWVKTYLNSIKTCPTSADLKALKRENAKQLNDPKLPAITKSHIQEKYNDRLKVLEEFEAEANEEALS